MGIWESKAERWTTDINLFSWSIQVSPSRTSVPRLPRSKQPLPRCFPSFRLLFLFYDDDFPLSLSSPLHLHPQTNQIKQFSRPGPRSIDPLLLCFCTRFDLGPTHKVGRETGPIFIFTLTQYSDEERTADGRTDGDCWNTVYRDRRQIA